MSFPLTGALRRVEFKLGPDTITNAQRAALQRLRIASEMAVP